MVKPYPLEKKKSLGNIRLLNTDGSDFEIYPIGDARLSMTPLEDLFQINFWARAEYEVEMPADADEPTTLVWGPTIEILTVIPHSLEESKSIQTILPPKEEMYKDWDTKYSSGYYNGWHNFLKDSQLQVEHIIQQNIYKVSFEGVPSEDDRQSKVVGECTVELSNELKRYW